VELTRRERNEIFKALEAGGVNPADCEYFPFETFWIEIRHVPTDSLLKLVLSPEWPGARAPQYHVNWNVHEGPHLDRVSKDWADVLEEINHWAQEVQYVADTPDFWKELKPAPEILAAVQQGEASNEPFTPGEQAEIARRLDEVKQLVRNQFELTSEQFAVVDQRLDDAKEASKHTDRKTWLYMFYGAVMSTFMTDEIPPHVIQSIVTTVLQGIGHIFGIGGPPPVTGP
jgi:hypothetical protein